MHLGIQALSLHNLKALGHCNKGRNISNAHNIKIPNWQDGDHEKIKHVENMGSVLKSITK